MRMTSKVTSKGQVTIPREIREKFGLLPHTVIEFIVEPGGPRLARAKVKNTRGLQIVERMRHSRRKHAMSTDEILALTRGEG